MATESGQDEGYDVPIQLYPHTQSLRELLMHDVGGSLLHDQGQGESQQQDEHHPGQERRVWISPPTLQTLREQAKQLQQQKRTKQRQQITIDANPVRFEVPTDLLEQLQEGDPDVHRSFQLTGGSSTQPTTVSTPCRRDRGSGVQVPLRMMASLLITEGTFGDVRSAGELAPAVMSRQERGAGRGACSRPREQQQQQQAHQVQPAGKLGEEPARRHREQSLPSVEHTATDQAAPALPMRPQQCRQPVPTPEATHHQPQQQRHAHGQFTQPVDLAAGVLPLEESLADVAQPSGRVGQAKASAASADLAMETDGALQLLETPTPGPSLHRLSHPSPAGARDPLGSAPLSADHPFLGSRRQLERQDDDQAENQQALQQEQYLNSLQKSHMPAATAGGMALDDDEGDDGAMLIDMGSADRAAEGALLPTPERPRGLAANAGWDELRGLGMSVDEASAGAGSTGGGGVAATLALLSHPPPGSQQANEATGYDAVDADMQGDQQQLPGQQQQQQQEMGDDAMDEEATAAAEGSGAEGRSNQLAVQQQLGPGPEAAVAGGEGAADEGFEADDEGETASRGERARAACRTGGRAAKGRQLPGLVAAPPWSAIAPATHAAGGSGPGLANLSGLGLTLPTDLPSTSTAGVLRLPPPAQSHGLPAGFVPVPGPGPAGAKTTMGPEARFDPESPLMELLKLKSSLRHAVQGHNTQAMGLMLSLLAALPASSQLLSDSQVVPLVAPLQRHGNAQVAAAARQLMAAWKTCLKAAARRSTGGTAPAAEITHGVGGRTVAAPAGGTSAMGRPGSQPFQHAFPPVTRHPPGRLAVSRSTQNIATLGREEPRDMEMTAREAEEEQQQAAWTCRLGRQHVRQQDALLLARSQSDAWAEGLTVAAGTQPACRLTPYGLSPVRPLEQARQFVRGRSASASEIQEMSQGPSDMRPGGLETDSTGNGGGSGSGGPSHAGPNPSPSDARTVTDAELEARSGGEETDEDAMEGANSGAAACAGAGIAGLGLRGGGEHVRGNDSTMACSPLRNPTPAVAMAAGAYLDLPTRPQLLGVPTPSTGPPPPAAATPAALSRPTLSPLLLLMREHARVPTVAGAMPRSPGKAPIGSALGTGCVSSSGGRSPVAGPLPLQPWRTSGGVLPQRPPGMSCSDGAPVLAVPLGPGAVAAGPTVLVPPALAHPMGRKRKIERPTSRRRCANPGKRPASLTAAGQLADAAGALGEEELPAPVHGPAVTHKVAGRANLAGLHPPLTKRQRYHAGGAAGAHGGAHHTAAQLRRMSHMLGSLDLGGGEGEGEGNEAWDEDRLAAMEGDVETEADMGSQDDEAAMLTSEDDTLPFGADARGLAEAGGGGEFADRRDGGGAPSAMPLGGGGGGGVQPTGSSGGRADMAGGAAAPAGCVYAGVMSAITPAVPAFARGENVLHFGVGSNKSGQADQPDVEDMVSIDSHGAEALAVGAEQVGGGLAGSSSQLATASDGRQPGQGSPWQLAASTHPYLAAQGNGSGTSTSIGSQAAAGAGAAHMVPSVAI